MSAKRKDAIEETISLAIGKALDETKKKLINLGQMPAKAAYKKEQAAAEVDPDVAAMEEAGGMNELDFRSMSEGGLSALRGPEYADEVEGQMDFEKDFTVDLTDMGRTEGMKKAASDALGGGVPEVRATTKPIGNVSTDIAVTDAEDAAYAKEGKGQMDFEKDFTVDLTDMGRTEGMKKAASDTFGGGVPEDRATTKPIGNVSTEIKAPAPVGEKARFDGADILDEADIARRADVPEDKLAELFKKTHGSSFDPKSKVDKAKMATITSMIGEDRNLLNISPTQFALKVYARKK